MWGPFRGFVGPVPPPFLMPGSTGWTSSTDRRNNPRSFYGKHTYFGDGDNHHDLISFALLKSDDPSGETLIVMHPVRASFFTNLSTGKLEALFKELSDLQESRVGQWNWMWGECEARQMTLDTLAEVLKARKQWLGDGDKGVDLDGDDEDD
jgi:hypothetical protein